MVKISAVHDHFEEIFSILRRNKLRTILTGLTATWGLFIFILLLGATYGLENGVHKSFEANATNSLWVSPGRTSVPYQGIKPGREILLGNPDIDDLKRLVGKKDKISGRFYMGRDTTIRWGQETGKFQVVGVAPDYQEIDNTTILEGRSLNVKDQLRSRRSAVLGSEVKKELVPHGNAVGQTIFINDSPFSVVGIFDDPGDSRHLDHIYVPVSTIQKINRQTEHIHNIAMTVTVETKEEAETAAMNIKQVIAMRHKFSIEDKSALFMSNTIAEYLMHMELFSGIRIFVCVIGFGSIIAGVMSISNIMMITVKERAREIGIRKALGATPHSIILMIVTESVLITLLFGYIGLVSGIVCLHSMEMYIKGTTYFKDTHISIWVILAALSFLVISGTVAGVLPARKVASIRPSEALKDG